MGYEGTKEIIERFRYSGDWQRDHIDLTNALEKHYYEDVGIYNREIEKAINEKVNSVIMAHYSDKSFIVGHNQILWEKN